MLSRIPLTDFEWSDEQSKFKGKTKIPTNIHLDLLAHGHIPDPFIGTNEKDVQWVHDQNWIYTCHFEADPVPTGHNVALVFEGLDTFATVRLNGLEILKSDNMFIPHHVELDSNLIESRNILEIVFESAMNVGNTLYSGKGHRVCWNGHYCRVYVRKAQYHFGWDWGPSLVTAGPWKPIYLETYEARLDDVKVEARLSDDLKTGTLHITPTVGHNNPRLRVLTTVTGPTGETVVAEYLENLRETVVEVPEVQLWYPFTHGKQPLYQVITTLIAEHGRKIHEMTKTVGFRRVELVQSPLEKGLTFYFSVNQIPMFMGGSNWIPGDNFLPRMDSARYKRWIDLAVRGNQNMIRIWGGGIYEDDAFYDECDRRGVLVWQDFAFACGQYPSDEQFVNSVSQEATAAIQRLSSHASLAILAGNNEDYQVGNEALHHDMRLPESEWLSTTFGARRTYERILPDLVKKHAPCITYWPGSPFGGEDNNSDRTIGDVHIWNVSSGMLVPYQRYPDLVARFVSEFGMLSCPHLETVNQAFFHPADEDRHPQSEVFEHHCKASKYEKRLFTCMGENFRLSFDLQTYVYLTQLLQSEAMGCAFRGWRRRFDNRHCGGALVWQLNDSWPVTSWAIVDYYERPKPAYYVIARSLAPIAVGVVRRPECNPHPDFQHEALVNGKMKSDAAGIIPHATPHIYPPKKSKFSVWVANSNTEEVHGTVKLRYISIATGKDVRDAESIPVVVKELGTTEVVTNADCPEDEPTVIAATFLDRSGTLMSRESDWPQPLKHMTFPDRQIRVELVGEEVHISAQKPVKGLVLLNDGIQWSDNCLDIIPGDKQRVTAAGLKANVQFIYYGKDW